MARGSFHVRLEQRHYIPEGMMSEKQTLWVEEMCLHLAPIERETLEKLGEEKGRFFIRVGNDWLTINSALLDTYPGEQGQNLVVHTFRGLFKEVRWFQFI
jgi:hypothetical protein